MTVREAVMACVAATASGCVCTCITHEADAFATACVEQGGSVQRHARGNESCVADAGVVATWVADDDAGD